MTVKPFLTFPKGKAEAAAKFYVETFPGSAMHEISYVERDGKQNAAANERTVQTVAFTLAGLNFIAMDMDDAQLPAPSWANSYLVEFTESSLYEKAFGKLSAGGTVMMSADDFGIYQQVCWITDQFGITWQLVCLK